ncbi:nucleotidyl transferase AbiEii/AbiGii toxin family protein [Nocardia salmonicida]|uniref:nucleotidyl transferase AbiEii/AbiGii toxin family protein n=1 Tax=Nocardia salmonicida TaxID=53431 RepID=UPI000A049FF6|nr:nucleotidyl transferase AbiEii/AbiGii toxin family protein [Nocardia salmonicida]MBC7299526.1 nucleotidyl transferase AbiEii/AbiGii toxin family protein [Nocardia sp.]
MPALREHPDDLAALIAASAEQLGLDQSFLEKDFWAMEVLRATTFPVEVVGQTGSGELTVIFKGGTSLSRVYRLIERFSEDVDLLVIFPDVGAGAGTRDKALKRVRDGVTEHLGIGKDATEAKESTAGVKRNVRYRYPARVMPSAAAERAITEGVLLEMGTRGGTFPTHRREIRSLIADFAIEVFGDTPDTWEEFAPFAVEVLAPERTLFEKLAALHDGASRAPDEKAIAALQRNARHLYDIHCLLANAEVVAALEDLGPDGIARLCADVDEHSESAGFSYTPRPADGFGHSPLLDTAAHSPALTAGYRRAMQLVYGAQPSLHQCLETIRTHAHLL